MNCYFHPEIAAVSFCRSCGRPLCAVCQRPADGTVYCQDHVPVAAGYAGPNPADAGAAANPYFQSAAPPAASASTPVRTSPALAFILGWIPGVGAIYNGQYLKGLMHALIFGLMVTVMDNTPGPSQPLIGILLAAFIFYMPFEAYHTAKKRQMGLDPDEWSSILPRKTYAGRTPIGPIVLIAIGVLYLLNSLDLVDFRQIGRFWPVILIVVGAYMLYSRVTTRETSHLNDVPPSAANDFIGTRHE